MLMRCQDTSWLVYILRPFRLYIMPLMAWNRADRRYQLVLDCDCFPLISVVRLEGAEMLDKYLLLCQKCYETLLLYDQLQWNLRFSLMSMSIACLQLLLCMISRFLSKYQLCDSSNVMKSRVNSLVFDSSLSRVPSRHTSKGPIKPEWISRS